MKCHLRSAALGWTTGIPFLWKTGSHPIFLTGYAKNLRKRKQAIIRDKKNSGANWARGWKLIDKVSSLRDGSVSDEEMSDQASFSSKPKGTNEENNGTEGESERYFMAEECHSS